jgi:enoyl-CoA hydratase
MMSTTTGSPVSVAADRTEEVVSPTLLVQRDERVLILTLNRPESLNALSAELIRSFVHALRDADADDSVAAIILTGQGERAFTAGMDLKEAGQSSQPLNGPDEDPALAIEQCRKPVIVAVNGLCITGGMEIMLACDIVIAASTARFADTHVRVGLLPGWGISQRMARQIGPQRAKEISLTGAFVSAARAHEIGLINQVVEPDQLMPTALAIARDIAASDPAVVQAYKSLIDDGYALPLTEALAEERRRGREHAAGLTSGHFDRARSLASARNRVELA